VYAQILQQHNQHHPEMNENLSLLGESPNASGVKKQHAEKKERLPPQEMIREEICLPTIVSYPSIDGSKSKMSQRKKKDLEENSTSVDSKGRVSSSKKFDGSSSRRRRTSKDTSKRKSHRSPRKCRTKSHGDASSIDVSMPSVTASLDDSCRSESVRSESVRSESEQSLPPQSTLQIFPDMAFEECVDDLPSLADLASFLLMTSPPLPVRATVESGD
jgi:hypothetical protein